MRMGAVLSEFYPDSVVHLTDKGVLFLIGGEEVWIPRSQLKISDGDSPAEIRIEDVVEYLEDMSRYAFKIPFWLLKEKGLD